MLRRYDFLAARKDPLSLPCEWQECEAVFSETRLFGQHLIDHLCKKRDEQKMAIGGEQQPLLLRCHWRQCAMDAECEVGDLLRHVYFHLFHVKIKSIGMSLLCRSGLQGCQLDSGSRNLIPQLPDRLQCGWQFCDAFFDDIEEFYGHVRNHVECYPEGNHVTTGCKCHWESCKVVVRSKHKLRDHMRTHTQEKVIACPTCGSLFSSTTKFIDHMRRQTDSKVHNFQCSHCSKKFATERLLRDHMRHHVNHYKCPFCDMTCPTPSGLRTHIRHRHTTEKPYKCEQCSYRGKTLMLLSRHMETHSDHWYECGVPECNFRCHSLTNINSHYKNRHVEPVGTKYLCHLCDQKFPRGARLTNHLKEFHNFKWPSGHSRFRYKPHADGFYRLQTVRYESLELTEQTMVADTRTAETSGGQGDNLQMLADVAMDAGSEVLTEVPVDHL